MANALSALRWLCRHFEEVVLTIVVTLLFTTVVSNVLIRWLPFQIIWTEELAKYLFVWTIFMGVSSAVKYDDHVRVSFFVDLLPPKYRSIVMILANCLFLAFAAFVAYQGWLMFQLHVSIGKSIDSVHFPIAIFSVIIPLAFGLTVIRLLQRLFTDLRTFGTDRTPGEDRVRETL